MQVLALQCSITYSSTGAVGVYSLVYTIALTHIPTRITQPNSCVNAAPTLTPPTGFQLASANPALWVNPNPDPGERVNRAGLKMLPCMGAGHNYHCGRGRHLPPHFLQFLSTIAHYSLLIFAHLLVLYQRYLYQRFTLYTCTRDTLVPEIHLYLSLDLLHTCTLHSVLHAHPCVMQHRLPKTYQQETEVIELELPAWN